MQDSKLLASTRYNNVVDVALIDKWQGSLCLPQMCDLWYCMFSNNYLKVIAIASLAKLCICLIPIYFFSQLSYSGISLELKFPHLAKLLQLL